MENDGYKSDSQESLLTATTFHSPNASITDTISVNGQEYIDQNQVDQLELVDHDLTLDFVESHATNLGTGTISQFDGDDLVSDDETSTVSGHSKSGLSIVSVTSQSTFAGGEQQPGNSLFQQLHSQNNKKVHQPSNFLKFDRFSSTTSNHSSTLNSEFQLKSSGLHHGHGASGRFSQNHGHHSQLNSTASNSITITDREDRATTSFNPRKDANHNYSSSLLNSARINLPPASSIIKFKKLASAAFHRHSYAPLYSKKELEILKKFTYRAGQFCHILCLFLPIILAFLVPPGGDNFSWHPFLMSTAYSFINLQAILIYSPESPYSSHSSSFTSSSSGNKNERSKADREKSSKSNLNLVNNEMNQMNINLQNNVQKSNLKKKQEKIKFHWVLQMIAFTLVIFGLTSIYKHKNQSQSASAQKLLSLDKINQAIMQAQSQSQTSKSHFKSLHSKLGLTAITLNTLQILIGLPMIVPVFRQKPVSLCKSYKIPLKTLHACLGVSTVCCASLAQVVAFNSEWFIREISGHGFFRFLLSLIPVSQMLIILNQVVNRHFIGMGLERGFYQRGVY